MASATMIAFTTLVFLFAAVGFWAYRLLRLKKQVWQRIAELRGWELETVRSDPDEEVDRERELFLADSDAPEMPSFDKARLTVAVDGSPDPSEIPKIVSVLNDLEENLDGLQVSYRGDALQLIGSWSKLEHEPEATQATVLTIDQAVAEVENLCNR